MSFILDALRKVEKRKTGTEEIRIAEEVLAPRRARRYAGAATLVGIALVSALVTAGAMRFFATGEASEPLSPSEAVSAQGAAVTTAPEPRLTLAPEPMVLEPEPGPTPTKARQAAAPAAPAAVVLEPRTDASGDGEAEAEPEPEPEPELVLQGTSVLNGEPVAVISDQRVFVGDRIAGAVVVSIEAGRVVLEREGERLELTL